jgi:hypothetical protein
MARRGKFNPAKHPRDKEGQFRKKAGGSSASAKRKTGGQPKRPAGYYEMKPKRKEDIPEKYRITAQALTKTAARQRKDKIRSGSGLVGGAALGAIAGAAIGPGGAVSGGLAGAIIGSGLAGNKNFSDMSGTKVKTIGYYDIRDQNKVQERLRRDGY